MVNGSVKVFPESPFDVCTFCKTESLVNLRKAYIKFTHK